MEHRNRREPTEGGSTGEQARREGTAPATVGVRRRLRGEGGREREEEEGETKVGEEGEGGWRRTRVGAVAAPCDEDMTPLDITIDYKLIPYGKHGTLTKVIEDQV